MWWGMAPMPVTDVLPCNALLAIARQAIAKALRYPYAALDLYELDSPLLQLERASFVTLESDGRLRGCIGSLYARQTLAEDVRHNAVQAALHDPRFQPLLPHEPIRIKVSVLSPLEEMDVANEAELVRQLRPGLDGILIRVGFHQATFLPDVWQSLTTPEAFMQALKQKAGMASGELDSDLMQAWRYSTQICSEPDEKSIELGQ